MNETHEISILIDDEKYVDNLIISLVRQGYSVYLSHDKDSVYFTTNSGEVVETTKELT